MGSDRTQMDVMVLGRCRRGDRDEFLSRCEIISEGSGTVAIFFAAQAQGLLRTIVIDDVKHVVVKIARAVAALVHFEPVLLCHFGLHGGVVQVCKQYDDCKR